MARTLRKPLCWIVPMVCVLGCWGLFASLNNSAEGKPPGPQTACCNPDTEPGVGGNPFCFEGHTCCANGQWNCNNPDGSPSCVPGEVCADGCGEKNDSCTEDADCCSGVCKNNGRCR